MQVLKSVCKHEASKERVISVIFNCFKRFFLTAWGQGILPIAVACQMRRDLVDGTARLLPVGVRQRQGSFN